MHFVISRILYWSRSWDWTAVAVNPRPQYSVCMHCTGRRMVSVWNSRICWKVKEKGGYIINIIMAMIKKRWKLHHFIFGTLETVSHIINRLILGNWVFLLGSFTWFKFPQFRLICQTVLQLSVWREKTSTESFHLTSLTTQSVFNGEPEALWNGGG